MLVDLTAEHIGLLCKGLDAYTYWDLSQEEYHSNGHVTPPGSDDEDTAAQIVECNELQARLAAVQADPVALPWWIVTMRQDGDDEDSLFIVRGLDDGEASTRAIEAYREDYGDTEREHYINHVVRCEGPEPEHVRAAPA